MMKIHNDYEQTIFLIKILIEILLLINYLKYIDSKDVNKIYTLWMV